MADDVTTRIIESSFFLQIASTISSMLKPCPRPRVIVPKDLRHGLFYVPYVGASEMWEQITWSRGSSLISVDGRMLCPIG